MNDNSFCSTLRGNYYGIRFDSSYELSYIHACITNGKKITRCPYKIPYDTHIYIPDFLLNDSIIVEIKGRDDSLVQRKKEAAHQFCLQRHLTYKLLFLDELLTLNNYIPVFCQEHLYHFNQERLTITSYPKLWKRSTQNLIEDSIGFVYVINDVLTNEKRCNYILTDDFSDTFVRSLLSNNERIYIVGYANNEYDLYKQQQRFSNTQVYLRPKRFKRPNNVISDEERCYYSEIQRILWHNKSPQERSLFSQKMSLITSGANNPNFGNKWTTQQKEALSKTRIQNGKTKGNLNGMYGKGGTESFTGYHINIYDMNHEFIRTEKSITKLSKDFKITKRKIKQLIQSRTIYKGYYFEWTEQTKLKIQHWHDAQIGSNNGMYGKSGDKAINGCKVKVLDKTHTVIQEFPSISCALQHLSLTKKLFNEIANNDILYQDMYIQCDFRKKRRN